nr:MAG TPA: hypothetical protein [Siphoviridae sp. ctBho3]
MTQTENLKLNKPDKTDFIDIEKLNENMDKIDGVLKPVLAVANTKEAVVTLSASNWSTSAPYAQKVAVPSVKAMDSVSMGKAHTKTSSPSDIETYDEMAGLITAAEVTDGYVTFYCAAEKPTVDFKVKLKGVSK